MLELIDESLESFFRGTVPLSATDIDVVFDAPNREWSAKLTRPTVSVFLWDIRRSATRANAGIRTVEHDGIVLRQHALPMLELRYVVTAWTSDLGDERSLLAGLVRSLLAHSEVPREFIPRSLDSLMAPTIAMARSGEDHIDVFKAVEGQLKPGINMVVTTEFDTGVLFPTGPPVREIGTAIGLIGATGDVRRRVAGEITDVDSRLAVGALVTSPTHATRVNAQGQFLLGATTGAEVTVHIDPPLVAIVPAIGGIRFE